MKIYSDKTRTKELKLDECNLEYGKLEQYTETIYHDKIEGRQEEGHYEVICEYENGGKDVVWIVDIPGIKEQEAYNEIIAYKVYIPYSESYIEQKKLEKEIEEYQKLLNESDYHTLKYVEGLYTEEEYLPIKEERKELRRKINRAKGKIDKINEKQEQEAQFYY